MGITQLFNLTERFSLFRLSGPDAVDYLHRRSSQDILNMAFGEGAPTAILGPKAVIQGLTTVHRLNENDLYLMVETSMVESLTKAIQQFKLMETFELTVLENYRLLAVVGPKVSQLFPQAEYPSRPNGIVVTDEAIILRQPFLLCGDAWLEGVALWTLDPAAWQTRLKEVAKLASIDLAEETIPAFETLQLELGLPQAFVDYTPEHQLPEVSLEPYFYNDTKGCFLGQETLAKVKTYGGIPKAMMGLVFEGSPKLPPVSSVGQDLYLQAGTDLNTSQKIGSLHRHGYSETLGKTIGLAYLTRSERQPGKSLQLLIQGEPVTATVTTLPFVDFTEEALKQAKTLHDNAMAVFVAGDMEAAAEQLQQVIQTYPDYAEAYESLGVILGRLERYPEAIGLMEELQMLQPDAVMPHTNLSVFYMKLGQIEKAEEEKAKATLKAMQQHMKRATLQKAVEAETAQKEIAEAEVKRQQIIEERIGLFQHALQFSPDDPLTHFGLANAYLDLARYEEATAAFQKVISVQPNNAQAYVGLGQCYEALNQLPQAIETYTTGIDVATQRGVKAALEAMQNRLASLSPTISV